MKLYFYYDKVIKNFVKEIHKVYYILFSNFYDLKTRYYKKKS